MDSFLSLFKLSFLFSLLSNSNLGIWPESQVGNNVAVPPLPSCSNIECPSYCVVHVGDGYEIRRYNSTVWSSTSPIEDFSLVVATRTGFLKLLAYIQGENYYGQKIEKTAPMLTQVSPVYRPFYETSFVVSFYVPKANQADPPPAKGLHTQKWEPKYAAVRQFSGVVADSDVGQQATVLRITLCGTVWLDAIDKSHDSDQNTTYILVQYNSRFELKNRVNEIWYVFDMEDGTAAC